MCMMQAASAAISMANTLERAKAQDKQAMMDEYWARSNEKQQLQGISNQRDEIETIAQMQKRAIAKEQIRADAEAKAALGEDGTAGSSAAMLLHSIGFQAGEAASGINIDSGFALRDTNYSEQIIRLDSEQLVSNARRSRPTRFGTFHAMMSNGFNSFMGQGGNMDDPTRSNIGRTGGGGAGGGAVDSFRQKNINANFDFSIGGRDGARQTSNNQLNPRGGV